MTLAPAFLLTALLQAPQQAPVQVELTALQPRVLGGDKELRVEPEGVLPFGTVTWTPPGDPSHPITIKLARAVQDLEAAVSAQNEVLVLLAGGVRATESLDVYVVPAKADGSRAGLDPAYRYETRGGRRLPAAFAAGRGRGSWPLVDGEHLQLFAYERQGRIEFRAIDPTGQLHLARTFQPGTIAGFRADIITAVHEVRVVFEGGTGEAREAKFAHPEAPRLEVDARSLDFGTVLVAHQGLRKLRLRNTGRRLLSVEVQVPPPFSLDTDPPQATEHYDIPANGEQTVLLAFSPATAGPARVDLTLASNTPTRNQVVVLLGEGRPVAESLPMAEPVVTQVPTVPTPPAAEPVVVSQPKPEPVVGPPPPPVLVSCLITVLREGEVRVEGVAMVPEGTHLLVSAKGGGTASVEAGEGGLFVARVPAVPGEWLTIAAAAAGGPWSLETEKRLVLPVLTVTAVDLAVEGPPGAAGELYSVLLDDKDAVSHILGRWRFRLPSSGVVRISRKSVDARVGQHFVAVIESGGRRLRSNHERVR